MTAKERILSIADEFGLTMTADFVPFSQSRNKGEKTPSLNWRVSIRNARNNLADKRGAEILTADYSAGCAHCASYQKPIKHPTGKPDKYLTNLAIAAECETGKPSRQQYGDSVVTVQSAPVIQPDFADVLHSLVLDSDVLDAGGFESWARDLGYDTDSRKAEAIYRACLDIALKLRSAIGDGGLTKLREACQDY